MCNMYFLLNNVFIVKLKEAKYMTVRWKKSKYKTFIDNFSTFSYDNENVIIMIMIIMIMIIIDYHQMIIYVRLRDINFIFNFF